jgi:general L-amino acid transport system permease protein
MSFDLVGWCRRNIFRSFFDAVLSLLFIPACLWVLYALVHWALAVADWQVLAESTRVLMVGTYPVEQISRAWTAAGILCLLAGLTLGPVVQLSKTTGIVLLVVIGLCVAILYQSGGTTILIAGLCAVALLAGWAATSTWRLTRFLVPAWLVGLVLFAVVLAPGGIERWGGLLLTIFLTLVASLLSIPLGALLALGRQSKYSSLRVCCTAYIEVMRSVPLILVVYCVWIVVPLLAPHTAIPDLLRGIFGFTLFFAAYVAEYVRSGLQSVAAGQMEAAVSLGLSTVDVNRFVILPQAARVAVPALVGNMLDIFNTAPLIFIIGLTDFLRAGQMILVNPAYSHATYEVYAFLFVVYFAIGSFITFTARRLEAQLARGAR